MGSVRASVRASGLGLGSGSGSGLGFGVGVWGLGSGLGSLQAFHSIFVCQRHVQRGGGYDSEGTEIDGGGDGNHGVPSHQRRCHTDLDQGGRREG